MLVINNEVIIGCDVDNTLVRKVDTGSIQIINPNDNKLFNYEIHTDHVDLLRQYKGRGFYIIVWSANGVKHAESVVIALGLNDGTVDQIMTKPMKHMDDKTEAEYIVGSRVFIPMEGFE